MPLPKELNQLNHLLQRGLTQTESLWPDIKRGFGWVHQAAHILANHNDLSGDQVHQQYSDLLDHMSSARQQADTLEPAIQHFLKVSRSYEPGLFHCYDVPQLPRTNNDLDTRPVC